MRADLSIVIPTLNAAEELPGCLESLMEGVTLGLVRDLVISDGGSTDETLEIADAAGARLVRGPASRGGQLLRGVAESTSGWILILHADTHLSPGWAQHVRAHMETGGGCPAVFRLVFRTTGLAAMAVAGWANLRTQLLGLPYGDQGLLITRHMYDAAGGYPDQPLMEDVSLVRALPTSPVLLAVQASTSAERYLQNGWVQRGASNLWTLTRYLLGADPAQLAERYRK